MGEPIVPIATPDAAAGALWAERETLLRALDRLPRTWAHLDAHRENLTLRDRRVVAIDWGCSGIAAMCEDAGIGIAVTLVQGHVPPTDEREVGEAFYDA